LTQHRHFHIYPESERRAWQDPEDILSATCLRDGMTFVDVGCGDGFFSIPAARVVGEKGRVLAVDVDSERLRSLRGKAAKEGLDNIRTVEGKAEDTLPCHGEADVVFLGMVLHDFEDPEKVLANAAAMLKPGGVLANLDWKKEYRGIGPPASIRFDEGKAKGLISRHGFEAYSVTDRGPFHYLVLAKLSADAGK
jgi:ubiquinone/menaquinone biosynthesis C-methylase UbiE